VNSKYYKDFVIKQGTKNDKVLILDILKSLPPTGFLENCSRRFWNVFLEYLFKNSLGIIILALEQDSKKGIGYVIAIRDPFKFWSGFALTHLLYMGPIIIMRKYKQFARLFIPYFGSVKRKKANDRKNTSGQDLPEFKWSLSTIKIARIFFIGVLPGFRGLGLGQAIYSFLAEVVKNEGCIKIEAHIDKGNDASLALHKKSGWQIQKLKQENYKATLNLS